VTVDHNEHQRRYFSEKALPRMGADLATTPYVQRHVDEMIARLGLRPGEPILDVGCGLGKYTIAMQRKGLLVSGLELTPALATELTRREPELDVHVGDVAAPPAELTGRFAAVTGFFFLHHLEDLSAAFRGARSLLADGGRAGFLEPNAWFPGYYAQVTLTPGMTWKAERGILQMRRGPLRIASQAAGFSSHTDASFGALPPALANRRWGRRVERMVEAIPGWDRVGAFRLVSMA
jgi:SAM-dependent methyltransferase